MRSWNPSIIASIICRLVGIVAVLAFVYAMVVFTGSLACLWLLFLLFAVELVDIDHDAGDYVNDGGDYIKLLDYWEELWGKGLPFDIRIHSANPVGVQNMRAIIRKNGWKEIR